MSARDLRGSSEHVSALHTIAGLPLDRRFPLFQHYPGMKLGVRECVRFYADLLVPLAAGIIAGQADDTEWVVTAPPFYAIPAGANLMAAEVFRALDERFPSRSFRAVDLRYSCPIRRATKKGSVGTTTADQALRTARGTARSCTRGNGLRNPTLRIFAIAPCFSSTTST
jgi:hypothetical protein